MAKITNLIGAMTGRLGGMVYSKGTGAQSYVRAYQPTVNNPRTTTQMEQRAKVNLMGRMSQITPAEVILGLGNTKRMRRSEYNKILVKAATIDNTTPGTIIAKLAPEAVIFSKGAQSFEATVSTTASVDGLRATIGLTLSDADLAGKYGERIVVAVIDPSDPSGFSLMKYRDVVFDNTTEKTVTITYGTPIRDRSMICIYRIPYQLTEQGAAMRTETLANDGTDIIAKVLQSNNLVQDWGNSDLAATEVFTQA